MRLDSQAVVAQNDDRIAGVRARTPVPIGQMVPDRFRQPKRRTVVVDGSALPVVVTEYRGAGALLFGKAIVHTGDCMGHFWPAEPVGKELRQRVRRAVFNPRL